MTIYWLKLLKERGLFAGLEYLNAYIIYKLPMTKQIKTLTIPLLPLSYSPLATRQRIAAIDKVINRLYTVNRR